MNVPKLRFKEFTDEWQKKTLKNVSSYFKSGKSIKSSDILEKGLYPVYGGNGLRGYTNTFNFDGNASLIGRQGALCGNVTYVKGKNYMTEHAVIVQSNHDNYNKFLFYILFSMNLNQYSTQSAQPGLSVNNLLELFNYFPNIKEQIKIANFLSTVDKKISNLEDIITNLENQKKGLLQQIFNQELRFKDENGNNYPDWEKKKLGDLFTIKAGGDISKENFSEQYSMEFKYPVYANALTNDGLYGYSNIYKVDKPSITVTGRGINVGFALSRKPFYYPIVRLLVLIPNMNINFTFFTETINFTHILNESTGVPQLTAPQLSKINIFVPTIKEQNKIGYLFDKLNEKIDNQKAQLEHWQQIKKGLLQQIFV